MSDVRPSLSVEDLPVVAGQGGARHAFGTAAQEGEVRLTGLERMGDRLARLLRDAIEPFANAKVTVAPQPLATDRYEAWRAAQPDFTAVGLYRPRPLKGLMLVALEPAFVAAMTDSFYGGSGIVAAPQGPSLSASEDRLLVRLTEAVVRVLMEGWAEALPLEPELVGHETSMGYVAGIRDDEGIVVQSFEVRAGQMRPATIAIVYPLAALRGVEVDLAHKVHEDGGEDNERFRQRLAHALEEVRLPVRSVLARPEISVAGLLALKVGDVIPITIAPTAPLIAGTKPLAMGVIGEQEGRAALQIQAVGPAATKGMLK